MLAVAVAEINHLALAEAVVLAVAALVAQVYFQVQLLEHQTRAAVAVAVVLEITIKVLLVVMVAQVL
jgi:hypothetical protein